jgi:hypothetical protein
MKRSQLLTHSFAAASGAVGFLLQPLPAVDEIIVVPMQYVLAASIAISRRQSLFRVPWVRTSLIIWGGVILRALLPEAVFPPLVAPAVNGVLMFVNTEIVGFYVEHSLGRAADRP